MTGLLSFVMRAVLLAGFTFGFVVLFEYGPKGFAAGAPVELDHFETFLVSLKNRAASTSPPAPELAPVVPSETAAPAAPAPPAPPDRKGPPSAWEQLQAKPIGAGMNAPLATPLPTNN